MSNIVETLDAIVNNIDFNSEIEKNIFYDRVGKFLNNDKDKNNQSYLLNVISNIRWINAKEINDFVINKVKNKISSDMIIVDFKEKASSSSSGLISFISCNGICGDDQIFKKQDFINYDISQCRSILLLDDYIGSGDTIIENIKELLDYIKNKEILIIVYAIQNMAIKKFEEIIKEYNLNINLIYKIRLDTYADYLDSTTQRYVNDICKLCSEVDFRFGWKNTGALVAINKQSPNNNISILWNNCIRYKENKWIPLLSRELCFEMLNKKNKDFIKKNTIKLKEYYENSFKNKSLYYNISYNEFEFLVYTFACYLPPEELIKNNYFENVGDFEEFTKNLREKKLIKLKNNYIIIENKNLYNEISLLIKKIYKNNNKFKKNINVTIDQ